jgi:hypothetical protein
MLVGGYEKYSKFQDVFTAMQKPETISFRWVSWHKNGLYRSSLAHSADTVALVFFF